jgi:hypothetical protein
MPTPRLSRSTVVRPPHAMALAPAVESSSSLERDQLITARARARAGHGVARWNRCNLPRESRVHESNSL